MVCAKMSIFCAENTYAGTSTMGKRAVQKVCLLSSGLKIKRTMNMSRLAKPHAAAAVATQRTGSRLVGYRSATATPIKASAHHIHSRREGSARNQNATAPPIAKG